MNKRTFFLAAVALMLLAASTFAQDTAYVPFIVNVNAKITAQQDEKIVSKYVTANTLDTLLIVQKGQVPVLSPGRTQKPVAMHSSRGKLSLELSPQFYKNAEISLHSLNGKRVLHDRVSASAAAKNISHPNIATGVYVLYVKGGGNTFSTRLAHQGGGMNIDVSFGGGLYSLKKEESEIFGAWEITVSAEGYSDSAYTLNIDTGLNPMQNITLLGISLSSSSIETPSSSSSDDDTPSSSSDDEPSSSSGDNGDSSSSVEPSPKCGETEYDPETQFCINDALLDIHEDCVGFKNGAAREHYGKDKKQFCDVRDGYKYVYVDIGDQTWMAENLRYAGEEGKLMGRCANGNSDNCDFYGRLYTLNEQFCSSDCSELQWGVANPEDLSINIACPIGWHLPSTTEAEALWTYSDHNFVPGSEASGIGRNTAATKLKVASWQGGTDELGFSGLPGGYCGGGSCGSASNGTPNGSHTVYTMSYWWSHAYGAPVPLAKSWRISQENNGGIAIPDKAATDHAVDDAFQSYSTSAFYTRCLKDKIASPKTPEPAPQTLACNGTAPRGYKCHYGKWKDYFKDTRDNKEYPYVEIGGKIWMAANLNYSDGGTIGKCYNDLDANCDIYGRLYNYAAAVSTENKICPNGWHFPTNAEWTALTDAVNNGLAGTAAKLKAQSGWGNISSTNGTLGTDGTDDVGFSALPGGYGNLRAGNYGSIVNFGSARGGFWWSAGNVAANGARIRHIGPTLDDVNSIDNDKSRLYSVRCVLD